MHSQHEPCRVCVGKGLGQREQCVQRPWGRVCLLLNSSAHGLAKREQENVLGLEAKGQ